MFKNFGRCIFDLAIVKRALHHLENFIKTSEVVLKRLLRVIGSGNCVLYRCHRCRFLISVPAPSNYASSEDETVQIETQKPFDLTDDDRITEICLSGSKRESTSPEKAAKEISYETTSTAKRTETINGASKNSKTELTGKMAKTADSVGNDSETTNVSDSEGENTETIHNGFANSHGVSYLYNWSNF